MNNLAEYQKLYDDKFLLKLTASLKKDLIYGMLPCQKVELHG